MSSNTGMAGLAVTALVAALVAFGVAALLGPAPPAPAPGASAAESTADLRREVERLRREVQELRAGRPAGSAARGDADTASSPASPPSGDAPVPGTREELKAFVDERLTERLAAGLVPGANSQVFTAPVRKTIDEAGAELGLSSVDIDSVKRVWRESEMEALASIMGTPDIDAIKEEVKAAEEDPDKKAALINKVVGNMVRNLGKIATIEDRRNRELKKFLTPEQVTKLKGMNVKPTFEDTDLENILKGTFGN